MYKLSTTFSNENQDAIALATRIVLNRRERLIGKDGEVDDTNTFHRGTHLGYTGAANGLEVLEAYADSVALGTVPLTQDNLKTFLKLLEKTNVAAQADIMRNEGKNQILNDMFNKDSVRTLFSEAFLEKALVGTTMEESIAKIQVIQEMERQFENISGFTIPKPTNLDTEIDNNLNAPGLDDGDGDPKPVVTEDKSILPPPRSVMTEQPSLVKNYKIDKSINNNVKYSYNHVKQEANSISETFILSSGSKFFKNEINCDLLGQHSSAFVNGIFDLDDENHHEIKSNINHLVENTKSYQLVKSVLEKKSKAVYQGKIFVSSEAQKTDGYQLSNAILLSENSEFNAKPELEIYADDVKCSHGSSSGSLDENSIFYLMSRGLNYKEAKKLLINGFLLDVIEKITDEEIKNLIKNLLGVKE